MGFLGGLGRLIAGKPVFEDDGGSQTPKRNDTTASSVTPASQGQTSVDERGYKVIPQIELSHFHTNRDGSRMTFEVWLTNHSDEIIRIDSAEIGGQKQVFNRQLGSRESHQFVLYNGEVRHDDHDHHARIVYRLVRSDDLFEEEYFITYARESDSTYIIDELRRDGPTRDI